MQWKIFIILIIQLKFFCIRDGYKDKNKIQHYNSLCDTVKTMDEKKFHDSISEVTMFYHIISDEYRIPSVKKSHVKMDTRLCCLEKAEDIKTSHVLTVTIPGSKGKRIEIPVQRITRSMISVRSICILRRNDRKRYNLCRQKEMQHGRNRR